MDTVETIEYRGFNIDIYNDEYPESPRDWDNLGTMYYSHRDYILGDKQFDGGEAMIADLLSDFVDEDYEDEFVDDINKGIEKLQEVLPVMMLLYILDHSGIWMRTGRFMEDLGGWDTSMVGFIFITREKALKEYGWKYLTKKRIEKLRTHLGSEVETFSDYISGAAYGFIVEPKDNNIIECSDSCWGYFGSDWDYMISEAKSSIDWAIKEYKEKSVQEYKNRKAVEWWDENCSVAA